LLEQTAISAARYKAVSVNEKRSRRVLIIDDEPDHVQTLAMLLREEGHRVETATDPLYALTLMRDFKAEIVFVDLGLPHMDGFEVLERIKRQSPGVRCYVITGRSDEEARQKSMDAGCAAIL
jgi:DNA-binding response OmpR family regulator